MADRVPESITSLRNTLRDANRRNIAVAREMSHLLETVRNNSLALEQRALTSNMVQAKVWKVWGYCRENKNDLDSGRQCEIIYGVIQSAVSDVHKRLEATLGELAEAQARTASLIGDTVTLKKKLKNMTAENDGMETRLADARKKIKRLESEKKKRILVGSEKLELQDGKNTMKGFLASRKSLAKVPN